MATKAIVYDIVTGAVKDELPAVSLEFEHVFSGVGSWRCALPLSLVDSGGNERLSQSTFSVARSLVVFERDDTPLFVGFVDQESGEINEDDESLEIGGPEAAVGYLGRRVMGFNVAYNNVEQLSIMTSLVDTYAGPLGGADVGTQVITFPSAPFLRTRNYLAGDRKYILELVQELSEVIGGVEFAAGAAGSQATGFSPSLTIGAPLLRRTGYVLATGLNVSKVRWSVDGSKVSNVVHVTGAATGDSPIASVAYDTAKWSTYPILETAESRSTVTEQSTLFSYANKYLKMYASPPLALSLTANPDNDDCRPGSFRAGDEFRVIVKRGRLNVDDYYRVRSWRLSVDADGNEELTMEMTFTESTS